MTERTCLLVDIGNSRIKWGLGLRGVVRPGPAFATLDADFTHAWGDLPPPSAVWVSNVAGPALAERLQNWAKRRWGLTARFAESTAAAHGVINGYADPVRLGVDRWLALIGAQRRFSDAVCVADCGTAITVDVLNDAGEHLGGVIAPGLTVMHQALVTNTHALRLSGEFTTVELGRDTADAISAGIHWAAAGLIERTRAEATRRLGKIPHLILTGGDGARLAAALPGPLDYLPELLLEGLLVMATEDT